MISKYWRKYLSSILSSMRLTDWKTNDQIQQRSYHYFPAVEKLCSPAHQFRTTQNSCSPYSISYNLTIFPLRRILPSNSVTFLQMNRLNNLKRCWSLTCWEESSRMLKRQFQNFMRLLLTLKWLRSKKKFIVDCLKRTKIKWSKDSQQRISIHLLFNWGSVVIIRSWFPISLKNNWSKSLDLIITKHLQNQVEKFNWYSSFLENSKTKEKKYLFSRNLLSCLIYLKNFSILKSLMYRFWKEVYQVQWDIKLSQDLTRTQTLIFSWYQQKLVVLVLIWFQLHKLSFTIQIGILKTTFKPLPEPIESVKKNKLQCTDLLLQTPMKLRCSKYLQKSLDLTKLYSQVNSSRILVVSSMKHKSKCQRNKLKHYWKKEF